MRTESDERRAVRVLGAPLLPRQASVFQSVFWKLSSLYGLLETAIYEKQCPRRSEWVRAVCR